MITRNLWKEVKSWTEYGHSLGYNWKLAMILANNQVYPTEFTNPELRAYLDNLYPKSTTIYL